MNAIPGKKALNADTYVYELRGLVESRDQGGDGREIYVGCEWTDIGECIIDTNLYRNKDCKITHLNSPAKEHKETMNHFSFLVKML